ncbi:MAG: type II toxin-antitoxin system PemK/MazF family toxin [Burkholderiales bacterium]|nr:MAG: type II toxin-antitoxin system PemK/MazF family toxin [Burkholderiales bacterium]
MSTTSKAAPLKDWVPDRKDIIWINFNPQVGKEMKDLHPMLVLSPKIYNAKTNMVIGLPMSSAEFNATNPFAIDNSKATGEPSYIICNQPKSFDWLHRGARPHPWGKVKEPTFKLVCGELNDIIGLVSA